MNERIRELAEQARKNSARWGVYTEEEFYEKFAQLIVNECAEWINDNVGLIDEEAKADLLKHFGVEE